MGNSDDFKTFDELRDYARLVAMMLAADCNVHGWAFWCDVERFATLMVGVEPKTVLARLREDFGRLSISTHSAYFAAWNMARQEVVVRMCRNRGEDVSDVDLGWMEKFAGQMVAE